MRTVPAAFVRCVVAGLLLAACSPSGSGAAPPEARGAGDEGGASGAAASAPDTRRATATFAMGCFWCAEDAFEGIDGVLEVVSGYTGGRERNPTYEQVSAHRTGHFEAIAVIYDPGQVTYEQLLDVFWHNVDPLDGEGQFCDRGAQYRAAIFAHDVEQRRLAEASRERVAQELGRPVRVEVLPAQDFWKAEEYHQDYAQKNPLRYRFYRSGCGRDARLREVWGEAAGGHH